MVLFVSEGAVGGSGLQVNAQWAFVLSIKYEAQWLCNLMFKTARNCSLS